MKARVVALMAFGLLAGCGKTMCEIPGANADEANASGAATMMHVVDYGPRVAVAGVPFNKQPDGKSALWFKLDDSMDGSEVNVHIGDKMYPADISGDVVTVKIPDELHATPGTVSIYIDKVDGRTLTKSNVVTLLVQKP